MHQIFKIRLNQVLVSLLPVLILSTTSAADVHYEWLFSDAAGTSISKSVTSGTHKARWIGDFNDSATNGSGQFVVGRTPKSESDAFFPLASSVSESETFWVIVEVSGWEFNGKTASETMRVGLVDNAWHGRTPDTFAQIELRRTDSEVVSVSGESFGSKADPIGPLDLFTDNQTEPVTLALRIEKSERAISLFKKTGSEDFQLLGEGKTSPSREMNYMRLGFTGYFNAKNEHLSIDKVAFTTRSPMETP